MTAKDALDAANDAEPRERLRRFEMVCGPRGACRREQLASDRGRWTCCPDCLTVYDDYERAVIEPAARALLARGDERAQHFGTTGFTA